MEFLSNIFFTILTAFLAALGIYIALRKAVKDIEKEREEKAKKE